MTDNRTTELREKLTERGVKWWPMCNNGYYEERDTEFVANGKKHTAHEWGDGLAVYNLTPEQAISATLGNGECRITASSTDGLTSDEPRHWFRLSCGHSFTVDGLDAPVACPVCGKAVKR